MMKPKAKQIVCKWCGHTQSITKDLEKAYQQGRADVLEEISERMYLEAFEVDHEKDGMQKWDSGNWIRYKLFENVIEQIKEQTNE